MAKLKKATKSKAVWGVVAMVLGALLPVFGIPFDAAQLADGLSLSEAIILAGAVFAVLGARLAAGPLTVFGVTFGAKEEDPKPEPADTYGFVSDGGEDTYSQAWQEPNKY